MTPDPQTIHVRQQIDGIFDQLGVDDAVEPCETILIRNGHYCGRRFQRGGMEAIWFVEENEVKFYDPSGSLLKVIRSEEPTSHQRREAA